MPAWMASVLNTSHCQALTYLDDVSQYLKIKLSPRRSFACQGRSTTAPGEGARVDRRKHESRNIADN